MQMDLSKLTTLSTNLASFETVHRMPPHFSTGNVPSSNFVPMAVVSKEQPDFYIDAAPSFYDVTQSISAVNRTKLPECFVDNTHSPQLAALESFSQKQMDLIKATTLSSNLASLATVHTMPPNFSIGSGPSPYFVPVVADPTKHPEFFVDNIHSPYLGALESFSQKQMDLSKAATLSTNLASLETVHRMQSNFSVGNGPTSYFAPVSSASKEQPDFPIDATPSSCVFTQSAAADLKRQPELFVENTYSPYLAPLEAVPGVHSNLSTVSVESPYFAPLPAASENQPDFFIDSVPSYYITPSALAPKEQPDPPFAGSHSFYTTPLTTVSKKQPESSFTSTHSSYLLGLSTSKTTARKRSLESSFASNHSSHISPMTKAPKQQLESLFSSTHSSCRTPITTAPQKQPEFSFASTHSSSLTELMAQNKEPGISVTSTSPSCFAPSTAVSKNKPELAVPSSHTRQDVLENFEAAAQLTKKTISLAREAQLEANEIVQFSELIKMKKAAALRRLEEALLRYQQLKYSPRHPKRERLVARKRLIHEKKAVDDLRETEKYVRAKLEICANQQLAAFEKAMEASVNEQSAFNFAAASLLATPETGETANSVF